jgi:hypothetical protein
LPESLRFTAVVATEGGRVFISLPFDPAAAWGVRDRYHLAGTVDGHAWRGPLDREGLQWVVRLGPAWRREHALTPGAPVEVVLAPEGPQMDNVGADVAAALEAAPEARAIFESLPSFYRRNFLRWIDSAKRPTTRAARIAEMVTLLRQGRRER